MTRIRLPFVNEFCDRHGKLRRYLRRPGCRAVPLPGLPGSTEFMAAYQTALAGVTKPTTLLGEMRTVAGTVQSIVAAYLDCSASSTSPFKALAAETRRTRRNILENFREAHGEQIYGDRGKRSPSVMVLDTRTYATHSQREETAPHLGSATFLNTLRAMFKWALTVRPRAR